MGYTHYMTTSKVAPTPETIDTFRKTFYAMMGSIRAPIAIDHDDSTGLWFNGVGDDSHETMCIEYSGDGKWGFCKTACKPYDTICVATLVLAKELGIISEWSSDGNSKDHRAGKALLKKIQKKLTVPPTYPIM